MKVYATDADEQALAQARLATYSAREVEDVPEPLRLRRSVIFVPAGRRRIPREGVILMMNEVP